MPYEATVPVHRRLLWPAVTDAERLIGALPNASIDASGAQGVAGRLRVRTRDQTVTFRGVARIVEVVPASLRVSLEVEAVFGRAGGTVEGLVEIALRQAGSGTRVVVDGRLDINTGAAALSTEALVSAFDRVVRRWFAALAETSPATPSPVKSSPAKLSPADSPAASSPAADQPSTAEHSEPATESGPRSAAQEPSEPRPRRRPSERAALAVVPDLAVNEDRADDSQADDGLGDGERAEDGGSGTEAAPAQLAQHTESHATSPSQTSPSRTSQSQTSDTSNGPGESARRVPDRDDADTESLESAPPAAVPLRLVTPRSQVAGEVSLPDSAEPDEAGGEPASNGSHDLAEAEPEDIWSRLRDRSLPPWIPFLVGVATASAAGLAVVLAALRRRYRR